MTERFTYDPVGRLIAHVDPQRHLKRYLADPAGDRLRTRVIERAAGNNGDEQWGREGEYEGIFYRFDRAGNLIRRSSSDGETQFSWDASQRLIESTTKGRPTIYRYDPLRRRISKQTGGTVTQFYWDGDALLGDVTTNDTQELQKSRFVREWIYYPETFEPLATLRYHAAPEQQASSGFRAELYVYHNDPNGCPTRMMSPEGSLFWGAQYDAWGVVERLLVNVVDNPLRLQGQYHDRETGLYYNRYRYYDPIIGEFVSPDPLGLVAGINPYRYAPNLNKWCDPLGLNCYTPGIRINLLPRPIEILFGQRRIAAHFRSIDADIPEYLRGRALKDVAADLKVGKLHPDQLEVKYFVHPETGQKIAESNRTLAALSMAGKKPTKVREVPMTAELAGRLREPPMRHHGEVFSMPGRAVPVTQGQNDLKVIDVVRLP